MRRKYRYLLHVWGDVEPTLLGPFTTEEAQDSAALDIRRGDDGEDRGGIYPLDLTIHYEREDDCISYDLDVDTYSGGFFEVDCDTCGAAPGETHMAACADFIEAAVEASP